MLVANPRGNRFLYVSLLRIRKSQLLTGNRDRRATYKEGLTNYVYRRYKGTYNLGSRISALTINRFISRHVRVFLRQISTMVYTGILYRNGATLIQLERSRNDTTQFYGINGSRTSKTTTIRRRRVTKTRVTTPIYLRTGHRQLTRDDLLVDRLKDVMLVRLTTQRSRVFLGGTIRSTTRGLRFATSVIITTTTNVTLTTMNSQLGRGAYTKLRINGALTRYSRLAKALITGRREVLYVQITTVVSVRVQTTSTNDIRLSRRLVQLLSLERETLRRLRVAETVCGGYFRGRIPLSGTSSAQTKRRSTVRNGSLTYSMTERFQVDGRPRYARRFLQITGTTRQNTISRIPMTLNMKAVQIRVRIVIRQHRRMTKYSHVRARLTYHIKRMIKRPLNGRVRDNLTTYMYERRTRYVMNYRKNGIGSKTTVTTRRIRYGRLAYRRNTRPIRVRSTRRLVTISIRRNAKQDRGTNLFHNRVYYL